MIMTFHRIPTPNDSSAVLYLFWWQKYHCVVQSYWPRPIERLKATVRMLTFCGSSLFFGVAGHQLTSGDRAEVLSKLQMAVCMRRSSGDTFSKIALLLLCFPSLFFFLFFFPLSLSFSSFLLVLAPHRLFSPIPPLHTCTQCMNRFRSWLLAFSSLLSLYYTGVSWVE